MTPADRMKLLSQILLSESSRESLRNCDSILLGGISEQELTEIRRLADSHHVIVRTFPSLQNRITAAGDPRAAAWISDAIEAEKMRIDHALSFLELICDALGDAGRVLVIKSLDHWPDLGNDLDLFSDADPADVVAIMQSRFNATMDKRSWGDRLANKWNFVVPGLPELVEVHVKRLGQTGEQTAIAKSLLARSKAIALNNRTFQTASPEDRFIISTLQRMYRHFYIRLCDIADNAQLMQANALDYAYLKELGQSAGIWAGAATYLTVISDYVKSYSGKEILLPAMVTDATRLRGDQIHFRENFLRVPILPHSAALYASELSQLVRNGELRNTLRLSLLPGLATAAALEFKLTGSDKGIW